MISQIILHFLLEESLNSGFIVHMAYQTQYLEMKASPGPLLWAHYEDPKAMGILFSLSTRNFPQRLIALHWSSSSVWKPWEREWGQKGREIKSWGEWASNYTPTNAICGTSTGKWTLSLSLSLIITKDRVSSGLPFFSDSRSSLLKGWRW